MVLFPAQHPQENIAPVISVPQAADLTQGSTAPLQIASIKDLGHSQRRRGGPYANQQRGQPGQHFVHAGQDLDSRYSQVAWLFTLVCRAVVWAKWRENVGEEGRREGGRRIRKERERDSRGEEQRGREGARERNKSGIRAEDGGGRGKGGKGSWKGRVSCGPEQPRRSLPPLSGPCFGKTPQGQVDLTLAGRYCTQFY